MLEKPEIKSDALRGVVWMLSSTALFSLMAVLARIANVGQGVDAWKTSESRFFVGMAVVWLLAKYRRKPLRFVNRPWLASRGFFGGVSVCIFFYAIATIGLAKATIFTYTYPLWAALIAPLVLKDRISPGMWFSLILAFAGLYLIIVPPEGLRGISWIDLLALGGGLTSGWARLSLKKLHETDSSSAIFFSQCVFGMLLTTVPAVQGGFQLSAGVWWTLLAIGVVAAISQLQMTYAYRFISVTEGSLITMLTPVLNVFLGFLIFDEPMSARIIAGCALVLVCCAYAAVPHKSGATGSGPEEAL